jgi:hypothetical protein
MRPTVGAAIGTVAYAGAGNVWEMQDGVFCKQEKRGDNNVKVNPRSTFRSSRFGPRERS